MSERTRYDLRHPIFVGGEEITSLHLRRPKARDLIRAQKVKDELEKVAAMIGDLAEVSPAVVQELDAADFAAVGELIGNFMTVSAA